MESGPWWASLLFTALGSGITLGVGVVTGWFDRKEAQERREEENKLYWRDKRGPIYAELIENLYAYAHRMMEAQNYVRLQQTDRTTFVDLKQRIVGRLATLDQSIDKMSGLTGHPIINLVIQLRVEVSRSYGSFEDWRESVEADRKDFPHKEEAFKNSIIAVYDGTVVVANNLHMELGLSAREPIVPNWPTIDFERTRLD